MDEACPNCGALRSGRFCAACGQNRKDYVRSTWRIVGDLLNEVLDLDSRLLRTLNALLFKPGFLSIEFSRNRRASYVPPARLYLIISIAFFTTLSLVADFSETPFNQIDDSKTIDQALSELPPDQQEKAKQAIDEAVRLGVVANEDAPKGELELSLERWGKDLTRNPAKAFEEFVSHLPIAMFLMLPLYTIWLKLLYWRRFLSEHLVFALHLHAFLFVIGTAVLLLPDAMPTGRSSVLEIIYGPGVFLNGALQFAGAIYYLVALRRMYAQSWLKTILKFIVVNVGHIVFLFFGVVGVAAIMFLLR